MVAAQSNKAQGRKVFKNQKVNIGFLLVFVLSLAVFGYFLIRSFAAPGNGNANFSLTTPNATVAKDANVTVAAYVNTNNEQVNAVDLKLAYDTTKLQYVSIDDSQSAFSIEAVENVSNGQITITRGETASKTGNLEIAKITFKALVSTGTTTLDITNQTSAVDAGTDVTGTLNDLSLTFTLPPDITPPSAPTSLRLDDRTTNSLQFSWNSSTDDRGVTGYRVYVNNSPVQTITGTQNTVTGLNADTQYSLSVAALDAAGNESARSQALSAKTLKLGDINEDESINVFDLSILLSRWQTQNAGEPADLNKDGVVNIFDLSILLSRWGT